MAFNRVSTDIVGDVGASDSITREQIIRYAGYAVGATAIVGSVGVVAAVAPAQIALASGMTAGCLYVADCMENDRDIIPSWPLSMDKPVDVKPVASVTAPSAAEPAAA